MPTRGVESLGRKSKVPVDKEYRENKKSCLVHQLGQFSANIP